MLRHEDYSFVVVRCLRRIDKTSSLTVLNLLVECLDPSLDLVEWTECDELLKTMILRFDQHGQIAALLFYFLSE